MIRFVTLCSALLLVAGCSPVRYSHVADANFNFGKLGTYQIVPDVSDKMVVRLHPMVRTQLDKVITKRLDELGYVRGYPRQPSFVVSYRIESSWDPSLSPEQIRQRLGWSGGSFPDADPRARDYQILSLVMEFSSPDEKKLLWTGRADRVDYSAGGSGAQLMAAVEGILDRFPPAARIPAVP